MLSRRTNCFFLTYLNLSKDLIRKGREEVQEGKQHRRKNKTPVRSPRQQWRLKGHQYD
jgi:hypothetical protein